MNNDISRRQFFRLGLSDAAGLMRQDSATKAVETACLRPPGALADERDFLSACERCGKCAEACPYDVIKQLGPGAGKAENTPFIEPEENPCRWCASMDCVNACPSGALSFGPDQSIRPIGKAVLDLTSCLTQQGILCDACAVVCPSEVGAILMVQRKPQLDEDCCVGCGLCAFHCASTPSSLKIVGKRE